MQYDVLSTRSTRRGRVCSICKRVVKPGERGAFNGNSAWHMVCLGDFVVSHRQTGTNDQYLASFLKETDDQRAAALDDEFEAFRQRLLKEASDG